MKSMNMSGVFWIFFLSCICDVMGCTEALSVMCRGKSNQYPSTSLIQIEGVNTTEEVNWYLGKRIAYVYKAKTKKNGTLYRATWGRVMKPHGNSGVVRARFKTNLPPSSLASVSISLHNAFSGILL